MLTIITLSAGMLGYSIINREKCIPFSIDPGKNIHADSFYFTGESIKFFASVFSDDISWDFKDNSTGNSKGRFVTHSFNREGDYYVTANINAGCEYGKMITVKNKPGSGIADETAATKEIIGAVSTYVGKEEEYISPALADSFYEWVVLYHPEIRTQNGGKAKFKFDKGGTYIIQLTLDNNRIKSYTRRVIVEDFNTQKLKMPQEVGLLVPTKIPDFKKPDEPEVIVPVTDAKPDVVVATTPKTKILADDTFRGYLQNLVENEMTESEFYKYLCGGGSTAVMVNGERTTKTFSWLCQEIKGKKARKNVIGRKKFITIESVKLHRDETVERCVIKIDVKY